MTYIRNYQSKDRKDVINVCWRTGYMGKSAAGRFDDLYLFGLLFCLYYTDYEPENCFVAEDEKTGQVIGYILSSLDSKKQEEQFRKYMIRKIVLRAFFYTLWRYPRTFKVFWHFKERWDEEPKIPNIESLLEPYPAHLHIDIIQNYQRQGIGTELMEALENHFKDRNVTGVHLGTSDRNIKAVNFYQKLNFSVIYEGLSGNGMWPDTPEVKPLIFAKEIK
ncbi:MAG: GNAT family N-acetyltransferase [Candidatus Heimdallarchaeota archaeon]|nr:MAG: GNAT family N-acetyltransferase [Candidatus Heimdallarchaeota archaeon]